MLHKSGDIYTWGIGNSGRLGLDNSNGDPQADVAKPKLLQALHHRPATDIACGHSHSAAVVEGNVYVWGSAAQGKLGSVDSTPLRTKWANASCVDFLGSEK